MKPKRKLLRLSQKPPTPEVMAWRAAQSGFFYAYEALPWTNLRGHWRTHEKRRTKEKMIGIMAVNLSRLAPPEAPLACEFTRYGSSLLDDDNLPSAFKYIRDGVAKALGVTDAPGGPVEWKYAQSKTKRGCYGIRVYFILGGKVEGPAK